MMIYILMVLVPGLLIGGWAQYKLKKTYHETSQMLSQSGITGAEAARMIVQGMGNNLVARQNPDFDHASFTVEQTQGFLSDHYDPRDKTLRLSPDIYHGKSLAALGVAAHEAGHALQDAEAYGALKLRNAIVPVASIGSNGAFIFLIAGMLMQIPGLMLVGVVLFSAIVAFQLINLPCEFDASKRAREQLLALNMVTTEEDVQVKRVLGAAAMTYVAAAVTAIMTLLYYILQYMAMSDD